MTEPMLDPCGKKQPDKDYLIFLPGTPGSWIPNLAPPASRALYRPNDPFWPWAPAAPGSSQIIGGYLQHGFTYLSTVEIRTAENCHLEWQCWAPDPGPGAVYTEFPLIVAGFYTCYTNDWITPPLEMPSVVMSWTPTGWSNSWDWIVHEDTTQAFIFGQIGFLKWIVDGHTDGSNVGRLRTTFSS